MNHKITATIEFYFKGQKFSSSVDIDLDAILDSDQNMPDLYPLLAKEIKIDLYSYEYEMMQSEEIIYTSSNELIKEHIDKGKFNFQTFKVNLESRKLDKNIQEIIKRYFTDDELKNNPEIKNALLAASRLNNHII